MEAETMIQCFKEAGIDEAYWPKEYSPRKAFKKALKESVQGEEGFMVRDISPNRTQVSAGLVLEEKDKAKKDFAYDVKNVITLDASSEVIKGKNDFRTETVAESYKFFRKSLGNQEFLVRIHELLESVMAIQVLCFKAFFIPHKFRPFVERMLVLFDLLAQKGAPVALEIMGVDNNTETRNNIVKHFIDQTLEYLDEETAFCVDQRNKYEAGEYKFLKEAAFRKMLARMAFVEEQMRLYIQLLEIKPEEDAIIWEKMELLDAELSKNIDLSQKGKNFTKKDAMGLL